TTSITLVVSAGNYSTPSFCIQAFAATGTVQYTATTTGYSSGTGTITLNPSGFVICQSVSGTSCQSFGSGFTTGVSNSDTTFEIAPARLDPITLDLAEVQS